MPGDGGRGTGEAGSLGSGLRCCGRRAEVEAALVGAAALPKVGLTRCTLFGERPPGREKMVGEGVFRAAAKLVGDDGFATSLVVGDGVLRFLTTAVASAEGVTGVRTRTSEGSRSCDLPAMHHNHRRQRCAKSDARRGEPPLKAGISEALDEEQGATAQTADRIYAPAATVGFSVARACACTLIAFGILARACACREEEQEGSQPCGRSGCRRSEAMPVCGTDVWSAVETSGRPDDERTAVRAMQAVQESWNGHCKRPITQRGLK